MFRHVLVPVDLDQPEPGAKALAVARHVAPGAALTVVSIQPVVVDEAGEPPPDYRPRLDAFLARHGGPGGVQGILRLGGSISAEIRAAAEEVGADLIVMASHAPHFTDYLIGSNAAHVALHSACSVLVVR
jgi:nucleotide-binding universal stress UspA family protein